jgi:hypothetical protein
VTVATSLEDVSGDESVVEPLPVWLLLFVVLVARVEAKSPA